MRQNLDMDTSFILLGEQTTNVMIRLFGCSGCCSLCCLYTKKASFLSVQLNSFKDSEEMQEKH